MSDLRTMAIIVEHQAAIAAQVAKMEGMKAENAACEYDNCVPRYFEEHFKPVQDELARLAYSVRKLVEP